MTSNASANQQAPLMEKHGFPYSKNNPRVNKICADSRHTDRNSNEITQLTDMDGDTEL